MKSGLFILLLHITIVSFAQNDEKIELPGKESEAYHEYRNKLTYPPYGLAKVRNLIAGIKTDDEHESLKSSVYNSLTMREKFTYHMIHAESYSQICDAYPPILEENKKIFAQLPDAFGEFNWSERQRDFFQVFRDSTISLMAESIQRTKRVGINYKHAIIEVNAKEMIPLLIRIYQVSKKDYDILTVLMLLMKENKFEGFLGSPSYKKLYGQDADYMSFIKFNKENEALIIKRATDFYSGNKN